jgi:hypothetical protein
MSALRSYVKLDSVERMFQNTCTCPDLLYRDYWLKIPSRTYPAAGFSRARLRLIAIKHPILLKYPPTVHLIPTFSL